MTPDRSNLRGKLASDLAQIEIVDDAVAEILRQKTPAERLEMCFAANRGYRILVEAAIRREHEHWPDDQVKRELARRMLSLCDD